MTLKADLWFPQIVWKDTLTNIDNLAVKDFVLAEQTRNQGKHSSNQGGWQSEDFLATSAIPDTVAHMLLMLNNQVLDASKQAGLPAIKICNYWFNVNVKGNYNTVHNHQHSILSGVYYVDIPDHNMGAIEFYRDDDAQYYIPENLNRYNQFTSTKATYQAQTGLLLIFPSWLKHFVQVNQSDLPRISMSFNTEILQNSHSNFTKNS